MCLDFLDLDIVVQRGFRKVLNVSKRSNIYASKLQERRWFYLAQVLGLKRPLTPTQVMLCRSLKADQSPCSANAMTGSEFCYLHNPAIDKDAKRAAQSKGGKGNRAGVTQPLPAIKLTQPRDVVSLLQDVINGVRSGEIDLKAANCLGCLAGHLSKALELSDLEERVIGLEKTLAQHK